MPRPGKDPNFDYTNTPYFPDWEPSPDRIWALSYIQEDNTEDWQGFFDEYRRRYAHMFGAGDVIHYAPPSVGHFVRHDTNGKRLDLDWELMEIPPTEEELEEMKATRKRILDERRRAALKEREERAESVEAQRPKKKSNPLGDAMMEEAEAGV